MTSLMDFAAAEMAKAFREKHQDGEPPMPKSQRLPGKCTSGQAGGAPKTAHTSPNNGQPEESNPCTAPGKGSSDRSRTPRSINAYWRRGEIRCEVCGECTHVDLQRLIVIGGCTHTLVHVPKFIRNKIGSMFVEGASVRLRCKLEGRDLVATDLELI